MLNGIKKIVPLGKKRTPEEEGLQKTGARNPAIATAALIIAGAMVSSCYAGGNINKDKQGTEEEDTASETDTGTGSNYDTDTGPDLDVDADTDTDVDSDTDADTDMDTGTGEECENYQPVPAYEYMNYVVTDMKQGIEYVEAISLSEGLEGNYMGGGHPEESVYTASYFFEGPDGNGIPEHYAEGENPNDYVSSHRVEIIYGGGKWVMLGLGEGELALGKEAALGIINVGETIPAGGSYSLMLIDTVDEGEWATAVLAVMDGEEEVCTDVYSPGQTTTDACGIAGLNVHLYTAAPGLNYISKWAHLAVIQDIWAIPGQSTADLGGQEVEYAGFEEIDGRYYLREIVSYRGECAD